MIRRPDVRSVASPVGANHDLLLNLAIAMILLVGLAAGLCWVGAALAAALFGSGPFEADLTDAASALTHLPGNLSHPADAWPDGTGESLPGPIAYWFSTALTTGAFLGVFGAGVRLWFLSSRRGSSALGVDRPGAMASARDLKHLWVSRPQKGRLTVGYLGRRLIAAEEQTSLAVVGPTGCGKTAGFAIPAILEWTGPVIAISVKNDLLDATLEHRRSRGTTWIFDPTSISGHPSASWSPLAGCDTWGGAQRMAKWLSDAAQARNDTINASDFWHTQSRKGLAPYLHAAALGDKTMGDLVRWVDTEEQAEVEQILQKAAGIDERLEELRRSEHARDLRAEYQPEIELRTLAIYQADHELTDGAEDWIDTKPEDWPVERLRELRKQIGKQLAEAVDAKLLDLAIDEALPTGRLDPLVAARALWKKEPRHRAPVFSGIENVLNSYADPEVAANTADNEIDLEHWLSGDNTIYIIATADEQERLYPVLNVLLLQAISAAYDTATRAGGALPHPTLVMLDEAGNIAPLRQLPTYAATARSHNISLVTIWQDLAQIRSVYRERAQTVLNNHRAKLFGTGIADQDTLTYLSRLIGDERLTSHNRSGDLQTGRRSVSEYTTYRPTAPTDVIRRVPTEHALLLYGRELPAQIRLRPWYERKNRHPRKAATPNAWAHGGNADRLCWVLHAVQQDLSPA